MADLTKSAAELLKKKEGEPSSLGIRGELDQLGNNIGSPEHLLGQVQDILDNYSTTSPEERKAKLLGVATAAALGYIFSEDEVQSAPELPQVTSEQRQERERKRKLRKKKRRQRAPAEQAQEEPDTDKEPDTLEKKRKVVCDDMRLICINTDPAKNLVPKECHGNSNYLLEYGLPEFDTFVEEMIDILAPDASDRDEGIKEVVNILKRCPMGKYQCTPQYTFQNVKKFKDIGPDWKKSGQEEEKMRAMWEFLQNADMQKEAARGALSQAASQYGDDPELVAASFYGGVRAADALKAYKDGTATPEQKEFVEKRQGAYQSILSYSGTSKSAGPFNIEAELARTASRESGNLQGKKSKAREPGSEWEKDERFAYNRARKKETDTAIS